MIDQLKSESVEHQVSALERELAARRSAEDMMIHDVRNPLSSMITIADMLSARVTNEDDQLWLGRMKDLGYRALDILKATAGYGQMERGTYEPNTTDFDLLACLAAALDQLSRLRDSRSLTIHYRFDGDPAAENSYLVRGDRFFLNQLFHNLITSVMEASPPQGELSIDVQSGQPLRIVVHSHEGITLPLRSEFFDTSLGYASGEKGAYEAHASQLVAAQHGGSVQYTTAERGGSTLVISLPIAVECFADRLSASH
ncbi:MAG: HAMP domain-containing sensor histidine kinase [Tunicatimonas sp.]